MRVAELELLLDIIIPCLPISFPSFSYDCVISLVHPASCLRMHLGDLPGIYSYRNKIWWEVSVGLRTDVPINLVHTN